MMTTKQCCKHYKRTCCVHCLLLYTFFWKSRPVCIIFIYFIKYVNIHLYGNKWQICPNGGLYISCMLVSVFEGNCKMLHPILQIIQSSKLHPGKSVHSNTNLTSLESIQPCYNYYSFIRIHHCLLKIEQNSPSFKKATKLLIPKYTRLKDLTF